MKKYDKTDYPLAEIRRYLEPGPVVLLSSAWQGQANIMSVGWHMMMGLTPALCACYISEANHTFQMVRRSKQCVINLPTYDLAEQVARIGNCSGENTDKFAAFGLTPKQADHVEAPLIEECYANFECKLANLARNPNGCLFVWQVVKAHVARSPKLPKTLHYRGDGQFMLSGPTVSRRRLFKPEML